MADEIIIKVINSIDRLYCIVTIGLTLYRINIIILYTSFCSCTLKAKEDSFLDFLCWAHFSYFTFNRNMFVLSNKFCNHLFDRRMLLM